VIQAGLDDKCVMRATLAAHAKEQKRAHSAHAVSLTHAHTRIQTVSDAQTLLTSELDAGRRALEDNVDCIEVEVGRLDAAIREGREDNSTMHATVIRHVKELKQAHVTYANSLAQANAAIQVSSEVNTQLTYELDCARNSHMSDSTASVLDLETKVALTNHSIKTALDANIQLQDIMDSMAVQHCQESTSICTRVSTLEDKLVVARQLMTSMDASSVLHNHAVQQMQEGISEVDDAALHIERDIAVAITSIEAMTHVHKQLHHASSGGAEKAHDTQIRQAAVKSVPDKTVRELMSELAEARQETKMLSKANALLQQGWDEEQKHRATKNDLKLSSLESRLTGAKESLAESLLTNTELERVLDSRCDVVEFDKKISSLESRLLVATQFVEALALAKAELSSGREGVQNGSAGVLDKPGLVEQQKALDHLHALNQQLETQVVARSDLEAQTKALCAQVQCEVNELTVCTKSLRAEEQQLGVSILVLQEQSDTSAQHMASLQAETCRLTVSKQELCDWEAHTSTLCAEARGKVDELTRRIQSLRTEEKQLSESISALQEQFGVSASLEAETCRLAVSKQELCDWEAHTNTLCAEAQDELEELTRRIQSLRTEDEQFNVSVSALQEQSDASARHNGG